MLAQNRLHRTRLGSQLAERKKKWFVQCARPHRKYRYGLFRRGRDHNHRVKVLYVSRQIG